LQFSYFFFYLFTPFPHHQQNLLSDTHKPEDDQMIVHCTIFGHPEPTIKWFKDKIPLNLCSIPRYVIYNHPDDLGEHTIASIIVTSPSYLDNGDFIIEVENEMGHERRVCNVQFQTEEEYHALYFQKYMEHKELTKYHQYRPGEERWEDMVPEVHEFHFWEPEPEEAQPAIGSNGKRKKKVKPRKMKKIITPWGDEQEVETTDDEAPSIEVTDDEGEEEEEEEEEEDLGWNVPGENVEPEEDDEVPVEAAPVVEEAPPAPIEEAPAPEPEPEPVKEPTPEPEKIPEPEPEPEPEPVPVVEEEPAAPEQPAEEEEQVEDNAYGYEEPQTPQVEEEEEYEPWVRKEPEVEHPIILRRPKFYITDFQLRKKFHFVNKLLDVELLKGKTLRMQSVSASIGPVTCEWRHNGRLIKAPTARKSIEFYTRKNMTVLEIENTRVLDSGTYTVTHYNDYTEPLIDSCKVTITVPQPKETADQPPTFTRLLTGINHYRLIKL
jgi:hypothetical protein